MKRKRCSSPFCFGGTRPEFYGKQADRKTVVERENLTRANQMEEEMFLGLRKKSGVSIAHFEKKFGANFNDIYGAVTEKLIAEGLVVVENNVVRLTDKSLFVGNLVFEEYLLD